MGPKKCGVLGPRILRWGHGRSHRNMLLLHLCYTAKFVNYTYNCLATCPRNLVPACQRSIHLGRTLGSQSNQSWSWNGVIQQKPRVHTTQLEYRMVAHIFIKFCQLTRFSTIARQFSPNSNRAAAVRKAGRPAIGRYSWSSVWSAVICASTLRTTGSTKGLPSSVLYAANTIQCNSICISRLQYMMAT